MGILKNMKIWKRLSICFGVLGMTIFVVSTVTWWGIAYLVKGHRAVAAEAHKANTTHEVIDTLSQINLATWSLIAQKSPAAKAGLNSRIQELRDTYRKDLEELKALAETPKDKELVGAFEAALAARQNVNSHVIAWANEGQEQQASDMYLIEGDKTKVRTDGVLKEYLKHREGVAASIGRQVERAQQQVKILVAATLLIGIVLAALVGTAIARIYVSDVSTVVQHTKRLASGDFSVDVAGSYTSRRDEFGELARSYQSMVENIRQLLMDVSGEVQVLASSSTELSASSEEMASTTEGIARTTNSQRNGAEQMATAITQLSASIDEVSRSAQQALAMMDEALDATLRGDKAGGETQTAMKGVSVTAERIATAINVITEIANQTNLLSLNAAIEAAKAGEQGKGFAVVAEEVRKLAERSATSAKDIAQHIQAARDAVGQGAATVEITARFLKKIRSGLEQFAAQTRQVTSATVEQSRTGAEVMKQVERSVQESIATASAASQMSATTSEIARTASDLARVAERLETRVRKFTLRQQAA